MKKNVDTRYESPIQTFYLPPSRLPFTSLVHFRFHTYAGLPAYSIVQDLPVNVSLLKMAQVYRSVTITISAARSSLRREFLQNRKAFPPFWLRVCSCIPFALPRITGHFPKGRLMSRLRGLSKRNHSKSIGEISLFADMSCGHDLSLANAQR
jgi:hypothetical protein